jgi:hypothetical protein
MTTTKILREICQTTSVMLLLWFCVVNVALGWEDFYVIGIDAEVRGPVHSVTVEDKRARVTVIYDTTGKPVETITLAFESNGDTSRYRTFLVENSVEGWREWRTFNSRQILVKRLRTELNSAGQIVKSREYCVQWGVDHLICQIINEYDMHERVIRRASEILGSSNCVTTWHYDTMPPSSTSSLCTSISTEIVMTSHLGKIITSVKSLSFYDVAGVLRQKIYEDDGYVDVSEVIDVDSLGRPTLSRSISHRDDTDETFWRDKTDTYDMWGNNVLSVEMDYKNRDDCLARREGVEVESSEIAYLYDLYGNWTYQQWRCSGKATADRETAPSPSEFRREYRYYPPPPLPAATIR